MAKARRKTSAQTRVKLSQAAKRRKRAAKGTIHGGQFSAGANAARSVRPMHFAATPEKDPFKAARAKIHAREEAAGYGESLKRAQAAKTGKIGKKRDKARDLFQDAQTRSEVADILAETGRKSKKATPKQDQAHMGGLDLGDSPVNVREAIAISRADVRRGRMRNPERIEAELANRRVEMQLGRRLEPGETGSMAGQGRLVSIDRKQVERDLRAGTWRSQKAAYGTGTGAVRKDYISTSKFINQEMPLEHRRWLERQMEDPKSPFNTGLKFDPKNQRGGVGSTGARHRRDVYIRQLQDGASHADALAYIQAEHRGRGSSSDPTRTAASTLLSEKGQARGRKSNKAGSLAPSLVEFKYGKEAPGVMGIEEIRSKMPGRTEKEYIKIQQAQRESIFDDLEKNRNWTHERARAMYQGGRALDSHGPDRVVFFTTNLGGPAPSVPTDSLIGQYVIKRRKKMMRDEKIATAKELKGRFPEAVRDMHVVEASSGVSGGVQGRYGLFNSTGWRAGTKKSTGFGKPKPLGASVLYDSYGRPMYDADGNLRYTEGLTRPFDHGTNKELGLRIFVG